MSNKSSTKTMKLGYELRINRSGKSGEENWERVGPLFSTTLSASEYRESKYPNVLKYVILGVKINNFPKVKERFMFVSEKKGENKNEVK